MLAEAPVSLCAIFKWHVHVRWTGFKRIIHILYRLLWEDYYIDRYLICCCFGFCDRSLYRNLISNIRVLLTKYHYFRISSRIFEINFYKISVFISLRSYSHFLLVQTNTFTQSEHSNSDTEDHIVELWFPKFDVLFVKVFQFYKQTDL